MFGGRERIVFFHEIMWRLLRDQLLLHFRKRLKTKTNQKEEVKNRVTTLMDEIFKKNRGIFSTEVGASPFLL